MHFTPPKQPVVTTRVDVSDKAHDCEYLCVYLIMHSQASCHLKAILWLSVDRLFPLLCFKVIVHKLPYRRHSGFMRALHCSLRRAVLAPRPRSTSGIARVHTMATAATLAPTEVR